jgi:hypothetical protein
MNMRLPCFLAVLLVAVGCKKDSSSPGQSTNAASAGGSLATAPVDYLAASARAHQSAVKTVDTTAINQSIQLFYVDRGRFPTDLNELVREKFLSQIPATPYGTKLEYNATAGTVSVVKE